METVAESLLTRIDDLIGAAAGGRLLTTTSTSQAIAELAARSERQEQALREIALELQRLSSRLDA